ncbi:M20 family metallo-hydrolase [Sedimentibacter sp.]|uniref:M20 family metallo-hydrolase n=1 Tax=Sedimentibacter sp. TaxID=1960295 RepID=UPI0028A9CC51|nr:M20 family metallo-hydrolase [Sedimentibacter sp.]
MKELNNIVDSCRQEMIDDIIKMNSIPSINPRMGGQGEFERFEWIEKKLRSYNIGYKVFEIKDEVVPQGIRRNITVSFKGSEDTRKTLWFIAHVDTVNYGDISLWNTDPFKPYDDGDRIYGLGTEDNSQAVIEMLYICKIMKQKCIIAKCNIGFIFASDEETGSRYGLHALFKENIFSPSDEAVVPDGGSSDGCFVEIAEKSQLWIKFTVKGKQSHASMPQLGVNACSAGMHLGVVLEDTLKEKYNYIDELFNPPYSTIELTQKFANVDSPNILPGMDQFVMDLRVLPKYDVAQVLSTIDDIIESFDEVNEGIKASYELLTRVEAPEPTNPDAEIVKKLVSSISETGRSAYLGGIGGGTCAAILRKHNIPTVVWSTLDEMAHQPNEYVLVSNVINDTKIFLSTIVKYC